MYKRILVPVDGSDPSTQALRAAAQQAADSGAVLRIVHVFDELPHVTSYEYREYGGDRVAQARERARLLLERAMQQAREDSVAAETGLLEAPARSLGEVIAQEARHWAADLVVVGSHGRRGIGRTLLGSGAEQIVRLAPVPVLVVRPQPAPAG